ncbi:serine/threonine protein kinase OSK1-like isoform X1 [Tribolium madens]|uniref:serine/threonine protein kinase OSK1-like isoform X1 n=2 Tax=Tribolium madens TaxID=41895 RepID=UPI001CF7450A|nr:serine/threonine protein kinase OSK1-like isoform X1 [Tribolium madens]
MTLQGVKRKVVTVSDFRFTGRLLGKGNFARVEEAVHNVLNVKVAVKIIDVREIKEKYVVKNLHREARIMSTLNHPCIASLFQTMQLADNVYYLVTELVSGGDLCSFIIGQRYGKLEERPARVYARQFASALAHMHSYGIVHRDLKMENVMLNSSQTQIKIVDFGLSNVWSSENPLRTHCGSPEYAAPELFIAGREYGPEVDLWSLGIIFYGMVVGQLPFVGGRKNQLSSQERRKRLVAQINKGIGSSQRQALAPLSPEFRTMLNKLLAPEPMKRITTKELIIHPWITEKGRKCVQIHPLKELDDDTRAQMSKKLGELFQVDENAVTTELLKTPYGRLGGMYNILYYKHINEHFNPELIATTIQNSTPETVSVKPKSASLAKSQHTLYNQCIVLLNKVSKQQTEARSKTANPALMLTKNIAKLSRPKADHSRIQSAKPIYSKTNSIVINRRIKEDAVKTSNSAKKATSSKLQMNDTKRRPATTGTTRPVSKPIKRSSVSPAMPPMCKSSNREFQRRQICLNPAGMGDAIPLKKEPSNVALQKQRSKDPLVNEPIARSIAGYLIKNVPDYIFNLQTMRK